MSKVYIISVDKNLTDVLDNFKFVENLEKIIFKRLIY